MADDLIEAEAGAAAPAEPDAAAPAEAAAPAPAPDWSSPEFTSTVDQRVAQVLEDLAQQAQTQQYDQQQPQQDQFELDPFDPNYQQNLQQMIRAEAQQMFQEQMGQYRPAIEHSQQQWAEAKTYELLDRAGVTDPQERTDVVYAAPAFLQQTGNPEQALQMAAQYVRERNTQVKQAAIEEYKQSLSQAGTTAGPQGGAAGLEVQEPAHSYEDVLARWTSQQNV